MNLRFPRLLLLFCTLLLPACSLFEPGGPVAVITVKARSSAQVPDVLERVFNDHGYKTYARPLDGMVFERESSKTDRFLYGDWGQGDGPVTNRVKVTIASDGEDHYRLRCIPLIVREAHDASFEDEHRRMQLASPTLGRMLRDVKQQLNELWFSRDPVGAEISGQ